MNTLNWRDNVSLVRSTMLQLLRHVGCIQGVANGTQKVVALSQNLRNVSTEPRRLVFFLFGSEIA